MFGMGTVPGCDCAAGMPTCHCASCFLLLQIAALQTVMALPEHDASAQLIIERYAAAKQQCSPHMLDQSAQ